MKKLIFILPLLVLVFLVGCNKTVPETEVVLTLDTDPTVGETVPADTTEAPSETKTNDTTQPTTSDDTAPTATTTPPTTTTAPPTTTTPTTTTPPTTNSAPVTTTTPANKPEPTPPPSTQPPAEEEITAYEYTTNGKIVDYFAEKDLVHAIFKNANRYILFETNSGQILADVPLSGRPAEIHIVNNDCWISYPDLKCIKIHDKSTFAVKETIFFETSVSSFDVSGDYLFFTEDDQFVNGYRYNLKTKETIKLNIISNYYEFYNADVLVNPSLGLVYISDSGSTGSQVFAVDMETLELKAKYIKDNYGYSNTKRRSYLIGNTLYWGEFGLNAANVSQVVCQYAGRYSMGMLYVDNLFVVTTYGIYLRDSCEMIVSLDGSMITAAAITESLNVFMANSSGEIAIVVQPPL